MEPGDRVEVELKEGQKLSFRVTEIRKTEMVGRTGTDITKGEMVSVQYSDIDRLERLDDRSGLYFGSIFGAFFLLIAVTAATWEM